MGSYQEFIKRNNQNFYEKMVDLMKERGMNDEDANKVMERVLESDRQDLKFMKSLLNESISGYADNMIALFWYPVREEALQYIEENFPMAWFKPMFYDTDKLNDFLRENGGDHLIKG